MTFPKLSLSVLTAIAPSLILAASIITLPLNLFKKWSSHDALVHGLVSDYLLPKWYVSDFFLVLLVVWAIWSGWQWWQKRSHHAISFRPNWGWAGVAIIALWLTQAGLNGSGGQLWYVGQLLTAGGVGYWLSRPGAAQIRNHWLIPTALFITLTIQASISLFQWHTQQPLAEYHWLGETNIAQPIGLQTVIISTGATKVVPYGTTPHPNILAGTTLLTWEWLLLWLVQKVVAHKTQKWASLGVILITAVPTLIILGLTQSISALLSACFFLVLFGSAWLWQKWPATTKFSQPKKTLITLGVIAWLAVPYWLELLTVWWPGLAADASWSRRLWLQQAAYELWRQHWWQGIGLNQFSAWVETVRPSQEVVRFFQPVHHVGWLWLAETGVLGLVPIFFWLKKLPNLVLLWLASLIPILALDHYLLTQHHGWWLFVLVMASVVNWNLGNQQKKSPTRFKA